MVPTMAVLDGDQLRAAVRREVDKLREVRLVYLFGSYSRRRARAESDVDLAVLVTSESASDERSELARLIDCFGRVLPSDRLDIVLLNGAPSLLRHRVLRDGELLFSRDDQTRVRFVARTIQDYQDMQVRRESLYRRRVEHLRRTREDHGRQGDLLAQARRAARLLGEAEELPRR